MQSDGSEYYEPQEIPVGSRVRIRISPECPGVYVFTDMRPFGHAWCDGLIGKVYGRIPTSKVSDIAWGSHPYLVFLDTPALVHLEDAPEFKMQNCQCAGLELEIIA